MGLTRRTALSVAAAAKRLALIANRAGALAGCDRVIEQLRIALQYDKR